MAAKSKKAPVKVGILRWRITSLFPRKAKAAKKETCVICFDDDIHSDLMFPVGVCGHRFCINCVKQHIQVKLLDVTIPDCPQHLCKSQLSIRRCGKLLTPKLRLTWKKMSKEYSTPLNERVYCPYQSCSYLMSKTELLSFFRSGQKRKCFKCGGYFCVECKVPWHSRLSCTDYKKLYPQDDDDDVKLKSLASDEGWRQCSKCKHMVERSCGCNHMTCRCGNEFCYNCGAKWETITGSRCCTAQWHIDNVNFDAPERNNVNLNVPERNRMNLIAWERRNRVNLNAPERNRMNLIARERNRVNLNAPERNRVSSDWIWVLMICLGLLLMFLWVRIF